MAFQGSLKELPLADIVQLVAVSGKTGAFSLTRGADRGAVYIQNGQITHARAGDQEGEDAIHTLALWGTGEFQFSPGIESDVRTITRSNTSLLMDAARRSDEWKILSKKIPSTDSIPLLVAREGVAEPVTLTPREWGVVTRVDGQRTVEEIARATRQPTFEAAKALYGLVTAGLVDFAKPRPAPERPGQAPPPPTPRPVSLEQMTTVSTHSGVFNAVARGDEKRSLQILCTKVKQEAESASLAPGDSSVERLYRLALAEVEAGHGLVVVRELIRALEQRVTSLRGREAAQGFHDRMAPLL